MCLPADTGVPRVKLLAAKTGAGRPSTWAAHPVGFHHVDKAGVAGQNIEPDLIGRGPFVDYGPVAGGVRPWNRGSHRRRIPTGLGHEEQLFHVAVRTQPRRDLVFRQERDRLRAIEAGARRGIRYAVHVQAPASANQQEVGPDVRGEH